MPASSDIESWWLRDPAHDPSCFFSLFLVVVFIGAIASRGSICPDDHNSTIGHHCKLTDSDYRDPLTFGSGWARLNERVFGAAECGAARVAQSICLKAIQRT